MKLLRNLLLAATFAIGAAPAHALNIATYGDSASDLASSLASNGHTTTVISKTQFEAGINGYDVLVMGHIDTPATQWSAATCTAMTNFLNAGKRVVTEWNAVFTLFTALGGNTYYPVTPQCGLFVGTVDRGASVGTNSPVNLTMPGDPLLAGLPNPIQLVGGSEFFPQLLSGYDTAVWTVVATYRGWNVENNPAILHACYGPGQVVVGSFDYADVLPGDPTATAMLNNFATAPVGCAPPRPEVVPTLSEWALAALALLLALAGLGATKRRGGLA
jgi:hypothetical protein